FDPSSYAVSLVSLPFVVAAIALGMVFAYVAFMPGALRLRVPMLLLMGGLMPYVLGKGLAESAPSDEAAKAFFRFGFASIPLACAGAATFQLALAQRLYSRRLLISILLAIALVFLVIGWASPWAIHAVVITPSGLRFFSPGPLFTPVVVFIVAVSGLVWFQFQSNRVRATELSEQHRRQLRGGNLALGVLFLTIADILLIYGIGWAPTGWIFAVVGSVLALRSILLDDLVRARALDSRVPAAFAALALCGAGGWVLVTYLLPSLPRWLQALPV